LLAYRSVNKVIVAFPRYSFDVVGDYKISLVSFQ